MKNKHRAARSSAAAERAAVKAENGIIGIMATVYPSLVQAITKEYGRDAFDMARREFITAMVESSRRAFPNNEARTMRDFGVWLNSNICVGHRYEVLTNTDCELEYRFSYCPWAQFFRAVGQAEIGRFFCEVDEPLVQELNPAARFARTKNFFFFDS